MAKRKKKIETYEHKGKDRANIPQVGLVNEKTDPYKDEKKKYSYDPHLDPQLVWAGKAENTSFEVPTVSLHVHERIDPQRIIKQVKKPNGSTAQTSLFETDEKPLRDEIEFYKHRNNWSNRLIAGDSLLVMNSLLEKEGMGGKIQMIYIDPPYGIKYGSNFQPFVNKRDVKDRKDDDLTTEPEMIKAFRDTWELDIHSYISYLRDRILLSSQLLDESGSIFVQISDENVHHVRELLDEIFGPENFFAQINYRSMSPLGQKGIARIYDYIIWYAKDKNKIKFRPLFLNRDVLDEPEFCYYQYKNDEYIKISTDEINALSKAEKDKIFKRSVLTSSGYTPTCTYDFEFEGHTYKPLSGKSWRTHKDGMQALIEKNRIFVLGKNPYFKQFISDFPFIQLENSWRDTAAGFSEPKVYVVQTNKKIVERCMLMASDPGDIVFDPTCGSGTTAFTAEQWGRRWITCDTSRIATTLAKQRLMTSVFSYYKLSYPDEGIDSGFEYKIVPHITLKNYANNEPPQYEVLYDQPLLDAAKIRISGPFTVEAVPSPVVKSLEDIEKEFEPKNEIDDSIKRSGETLRQHEWREELLKTGVRTKGGARLEFTRMESLSGTRWLQAEGETKVDVPDKNLFEKGDADLFQRPQKVVVCFGPEHSPLEQRQVEIALDEAEHLRPKPDIVLFCAFQFDPEAAKDIDETKWSGVTLLKAQMNADIQTEDLKKKRSSNDSFWLVGQPDVDIVKEKGKNEIKVEVKGFDYYNPKTGNVESGGQGKIAMWMLDEDYDGRSLLPSQVFFPMAGKSEGWSKLAKNLKAEIDEEKIEAFNGTISLPFEPGKQIAVKIIDDRGIESLKILTP